jgi:hypothetical protein
MRHASRERSHARSLSSSAPARRLSVPALLAAALAIASLAPRPARAQEGPLTPWIGERGITETVQEIMERGRRNGEPTQWDGRVRFHPEPEAERDWLQQNPNSPAVPMWPAPSAGLTPVLAPPSGGTNLPQTVGVSFLATQISDTIGYVPPDTVGSVGPTQVLVCSNGIIKVFSKAGALGGLSTSTDNFFSSVRNGSSTSDPQVKYDRLSGRWIVTIINVASHSNRVLIAVSSGSTITNQSSFTFYFFQQDTVAPAGNTGNFADYPKVGADANAIVIGCNMFTSSSGSYVGTTAWVVRKSSVLSGGPIFATAFRGLASGTGAGPFAPSGVDNDDSAATFSYIVGVDNASFGLLVLRRITNPGGSPTISGNLNVTVPSTVLPQSQPSAGGASLDALDDRLFACQIHRNRASGVTSLWTAHNIEVNSSGVASTSGNRNGSRWYQVDNLGTTPTLTQSGTLFDPAASNPRGYWIPSLAMSGQGHVVLGTSYANATVDHAGVATSGRLAGDPLGTVQAATLAVVSSTAYNVSPARWGDYSAVMVDPTDDQTMWAFGEYCNSTNSWGVRAIQLRAPLPAMPTSANPSTLTQGSTGVSVVVTGSSSSGSGFYDTEPGMNRILASFSGAGITVNSIVWNSPTQITLNVDVAASSTTGPRTLTVTNPDGQLSTSASGIVTVAAGNADCNHNGIPDNIDIQNGTSQDCDSNGVPDECQADSDGDGTIDACDGCPNDPNKIAPGQCGCGVPDTDTDGDGTPDCHDGCPNDPNKIAPGICGCGVPDTDTDHDGTPDCIDGCPNDPNKIAPGVCGCGVSDQDTDHDGTPDCIDGCPNDPNKIAPGICGCGVSDADSDGDGTPNCIDGCPNDPNKIAPGACGCGVSDVDTDGDGTPDCHDGCPNDPNKIAPGACGCGIPDTDTDGDGVPDCHDNCPSIPNPGQGDCNADGVGDACEIASGAPDCNGNGIPDSCDIASGTTPDLNHDGIPDVCQPVGSPFCFGDGTGGACPCGNTGGPGRGCANSVGQSARLLASGPTNPDQVVLAADGELPTALTIFVQGPLSISPVIFGDGLRCIGGTLRRLYSNAASGGQAYAPHPGDPSITARSAALGDTIPSGSTRYYMTYYRDPSSTFCSNPPGNTFNASSAVSIVW